MYLEAVYAYRFVAIYFITLLAPRSFKTFEQIESFHLCNKNSNNNKLRDLFCKWIARAHTYHLYLRCKGTDLRNQFQTFDCVTRIESISYRWLWLWLRHRILSNKIVWVYNGFRLSFRCPSRAIFKCVNCVIVIWEKASKNQTIVPIFASLRYRSQIDIFAHTPIPDRSSLH